MKYSKIRNFRTRHLIIHPDYLQEFSYGQKWSDIPFPEIERVTIETYLNEGYNKIEPHRLEDPVRQDKYPDLICFHRRFYPKEPTWKNILKTLDKLIDDSGDHRHVFLEELEVVGTSLYVSLGS